MSRRPSDDARRGGCSAPVRTHPIRCPSRHVLKTIRLAQPHARAVVRTRVSPRAATSGAQTMSARRWRFRCVGRRAGGGRRSRAGAQSLARATLFGHDRNLSEARAPSTCAGGHRPAEGPRASDPPAGPTQPRPAGLTEARALPRASPKSARPRASRPRPAAPPTRRRARWRWRCARTARACTSPRRARAAAGTRRSSSRAPCSCTCTRRPAGGWRTAACDRRASRCG